MAMHKLGVRIDGRPHSFFGTLTDAEFEQVASEGLPDGWLAWHVEEVELDQPSARVLAIRALPLVCMRWQEALAYARRKTPAAK
jgi:hypothetical protein